MFGLGDCARRLRKGAAMRAVRRVTPAIVFRLGGGVQFLPLLRLYSGWSRNCTRNGTMSFGIYIIGFLIMIGGLIYGATLMHVPTHWIVVGGLVLAGLALVKAVPATRTKDPS